MEIKIVISDTTGQTGIPSGSLQIGGREAPESAQAGGMQAGAAGPTEALAGAAAPAELLKRAQALGALDAGPAPSLGGMLTSGTPQPFITGSTPDMGSTSGLGSSPGQSAGSAPCVAMEVHTFEAGGEK